MVCFGFLLRFNITLNIKYEKLDKFFKIKHESKNLIDLSINQNYEYTSKDIPELMDELIPLIIGSNYMFKDYKDIKKDFYNLLHNKSKNKNKEL